MLAFNNSDKKPYEKSNVIAIYAFAAGVFILVILSSAGSHIELEEMELIGLGFVTVLLLFRYFNLIKLGGILELSREVTSMRDKHEQFKSSTADEVLSLKRETPPKKDLKKDENKPAQPNKTQITKCLELLRQPGWDYRTENSLLEYSEMTKEQFENFLASNPEVILAKTNDIYGNKLYRLIR